MRPIQFLLTVPCLFILASCADSGSQTQVAHESDQENVHSKQAGDASGNHNTTQHHNGPSDANHSASKGHNSHTERQDSAATSAHGDHNGHQEHARQANHSDQQKGHSSNRRRGRTTDTHHGHSDHKQNGHHKTDHGHHKKGHHVSGQKTTNDKHVGHSKSEPGKNGTDGHTDHKHGKTHLANKTQHGSRNGHGHKKQQTASKPPRRTKPLEPVDTSDPLDVFNKRILPILQATNPSSCSECHLSGVDLKDYILEDQSKMFASLRAGGLIDVNNPNNSKILQFIGRKPEKASPISEEVRKLELEAFRTWIQAAVRDPELLKAKSDTDVGIKLPVDVVRHARKDRVLSSFVDNIWSQMGRCVNCHSPERNRSKIGRNGFTKEDVDAISWIAPRDPAGTLQNLVDGGNIDSDDPASSLVLTKPAGLEEHGGGPKFQPGGTAYRNFLTFLKDYAAITNGRYKSKSDLPTPAKELALLTEQHLRIIGISRQLNDLPLQVDVYRWNPRTRKFSTDRWATAFNKINGKKGLWQSLVTVTAPTNSKRAQEFRNSPKVPSGRYMVKIYVDRNRKTRKDPDYRLGKKEFVGEVEITGKWKPGYRPPRIINFPISRR